MSVKNNFEEKNLVRDVIDCYETEFKSKIIKQVSKLYYSLKRIIINTKSASSDDELTYSLYFILKEVFKSVKTINISKVGELNYYGYNFNERLIKEINSLLIKTTYGKNLISGECVYHMKFKNNAISLIIIDQNELNDKTDEQIMVAIKHIVNLAKFENEAVAA